MAQSLEFSIVVPVHNESGNVEPLVTEIHRALDGRAFEMVFVDDASSDDTRARLVDLKARFPMLRVISHRKSRRTSVRPPWHSEPAWASHIFALSPTE